MCIYIYKFNELFSVLNINNKKNMNEKEVSINLSLKIIIEFYDPPKEILDLPLVLMEKH